MNISFDLDNTIIPYKDEFETENRNFFAKMFGVVKKRKKLRTSSEGWNATFFLPLS